MLGLYPTQEVTMATEYGIWNDADGGFMETQLWSTREAGTRRAEILEEIKDQDGSDAAAAAAKALTVEEICPEHPEERRESCGECNRCPDHPEYDADDCTDCEEAQ
jgi:hypothetical protein